MCNTLNISACIPSNGHMPQKHKLAKTQKEATALMTDPIAVFVGKD